MRVGVRMQGCGRALTEFAVPDRPFISRFSQQFPWVRLLILPAFSRCLERKRVFFVGLMALRRS